MAEALPRREPRRPTSVPKPGATAPPTDIAGLRSLIQATGTAPSIYPGIAPLSLPECLRPLLPSGELARGTVISIPGTASRTTMTRSPDYLGLSLIAGSTAGGAWCGAVGLPDLGIAALSGLGADLGRVLCVDEPGDRWDEAVMVLAAAVDLVVLHPPARPSGEQLRRITARLHTNARQRGAVLLVCGPWPGAHLVLETTDPQWHGLGDGTGNLTGRIVTVAAHGRSTAGLTRTVRLWLPAHDGTVRTATEDAQTVKPGQRHLRSA